MWGKLYEYYVFTVYLGLYRAFNNILHDYKHL